MSFNYQGQNGLRRTRRRSTSGRVLKHLHLYLFSIKSLPSFYLFNAATIALLTHKFATICLHGPLPLAQLVIFGPFLFCFDFVTLLFLHRGLASRSPAVQAISAFICIVIVSCSATFVSLYLEANAEVNWGRSVEVLLFVTVGLIVRCFRIGSFIVNLWRKGVGISSKQRRSIYCFQRSQYSFDVGLNGVMYQSIWNPPSQKSSRTSRSVVALLVLMPLCLYFLFSAPCFSPVNHGGI